MKLKLYAVKERNKSLQPDLCDRLYDNVCKALSTFEEAELHMSCTDLILSVCNLQLQTSSL